MSNGKRILVFIILSLGAGLVFFTPCLKFSFYDQMLEVLHLNDVQINMLYSVYGAVNLVMYPISGYLGDKFSTKKMIAAAMFCFGALDIVYSFTTDYRALLVIHALCGVFAAGIFWCPYLKAIRLLGDENMQSKLFGMSEATRGLAQAVVGFAAVWLMGLTASLANGFRNMLWFTSALYILLGVLVIILLPKEEKVSKTAVREQEVSKKGGNVAKVLKNPGTWITVLLIFSGFCFWLLASTFLTTYSVRVLGVSAGTASMLGIVRSYLLVFVAGFGGGWLMDKFTYKGKSYIVIAVASAAVILGIMFSSKLVTFCLILTVVLSLLTSLVRSVYWSVLGQAGIAVEDTGTATGIISLLAYLPESFLTVICGSWITKAEAAGNIETGFTQIFILMIAFCVLMGLAGLLLYRRSKKLGI